MADLSLDDTPGMNFCDKFLWEGTGGTPGSARGGGDAVHDVPILPLLRSCQALFFFFCQQELSDGIEVFGFFGFFFREPPLSASKANRDSFRKWEKTGGCPEKL